MNLLFIIKPYEIDVYTTGETRVLLGREPLTRIEGEEARAYEARMVFVCKELSNDAKKHVKGISKVEVILCYPWCTYEHIDVHKVFDADTVITEKLLDSFKIQKTGEDIFLLESERSHLLLNGYATENPIHQKVREIEMQVLNVYTQTAFAKSLKNTIDTVFHPRGVYISSVYAYSLAVRPKNGLFLLLEEESVDISYVSDGKVVLHVFIPNSYLYLEDSLKSALDIDSKTVQSILASRANLTSVQQGKKTMKNMWPDLSAEIKQKVDTAVDEHYAVIMKYVYTLIDQIKAERRFDKEEVRVCALNAVLASVYGYGLAKLIKDDAYIKTVMKVGDEDIYIDYLF